MPQQTPRPHGRQPTNPNWKHGNIAFFKDVEEFNRTEYDALIKSGYLREKATKHPVIILEYTEDLKYFLVTTVSAYGSGPLNGNLPPWEQPYHCRKCHDRFRAFAGSRKPNSDRKHLELANGEQFPKPETSWVDAANCFVVPASTLKYFTKVKSRLTMTRESLDDLLSHMRESWKFAERWTHPAVLQMMGNSELRLAPRSKSSPTTKPATCTMPATCIVPATCAVPASIVSPSKPGMIINCSITSQTARWSDVVAKGHQAICQA